MSVCVSRARRPAVTQELNRVFRSPGFNVADSERGEKAKQHSYLPVRRLFELRELQGRQGIALSGTRPDDTPLHGLVASTGKSPIITSAFHKPLLPHQLQAVENRKPPTHRLPKLGRARPVPPPVARVNSYHEIPKENTERVRALTARRAAGVAPQAPSPTEGGNERGFQDHHWRRARRYVQMSSLLGSGISQQRRDTKKKNRVRQKTEVRVVQESAPRVVPQDGVSVGFLESILDRVKTMSYPVTLEDGRTIASHRELTCEDILELIVFPKTQEAGKDGGSCSYVQLLQDTRMRFDDRPACGRATTFIIYCREYIFEDLVAALAQHRGKYLWIDMWSEDQTMLVDDPVDAEWLTNFQTAVKDMGHTVVVFDEWMDAKPLTRMWCLYELAATASSVAGFEIAMPPRKQEEMTGMILDQFKDMSEHMKVDFSKALTTDEDDRPLLTESLGIHDLHAIQGEIESMLNDWLADQGRKKLRDIPSSDRAVSGLAEQLAEVLKKLGRLGEALPLMRQRLAGAKMKYGEQSEETYTCMHQLGELHHLRWLCKDGDGATELASALPLLTEALAGRKDLLGPIDLNTLATMDTLALVQQDGNNLEAAQQLSEEAVKGFRYVLGEGHPYLLTALQNLGLILRERGLYDEALQLHMDAYKGKERVFGAKAPETIDSVSALGWMYVKRGESVQAADALRIAVAGNRAVRSDNHPNTIMDAARLQKVLANLKAVAINDTDRYDMELAELDEIISAQSSSTDRVLKQMEAMGSSQRDRRGQELEMLESVYNDSRKTNGAYDPKTLECLATIGWYHQVHGKNSNIAVNSLRQALVGLTNLVDENGVHHPLVPKVAKHLKITLQRLAEAEPGEGEEKFELDTSEMRILQELTAPAAGSERKSGRRKVWVAAKTAMMLRSALADSIQSHNGDSGYKAPAIVARTKRSDDEAGDE